MDWNKLAMNCLAMLNGTAPNKPETVSLKT
jgi:hypothetical protein